MMKKKWLILVMFFLSTIVCVLAITWRENPKCSIESLSLKKEWMPEGWWINEPGPTLLPIQDRLGAQRAYYVPMENGDGADRYTAHHTVYQYSNRWLATFHMWFETEIFFPSVGWQWSVVKEASSLPLHTDQLQIRCGDSNDPYLADRCATALRYGPYISNFSSSIQEGVMSIEEFKEIVLKIDERVSACEK